MSTNKAQYPIYVISKGRAESRLTVKWLSAMGQPYHIVIEPPEYEAYAKYIPEDNILVLPFADLGQGSIPARNWVWEHAQATGAKRHWIMDDNLNGWWRSNKNIRARTLNPIIFRLMEDFTDRYLNVPMSGPNYYMFAPSKGKWPPFRINTRVYSCILLENDKYPDYAWRGRYNEDTDLSLRFLKAGYCTILFNAFLVKKVTTMTMKGGNTESLYKLDNEDGRLLMARSLVEQHPDVTRITKKWGRYQHQVDYRVFRQNRLKRDPAYKPKGGANEHGLELKRWDESPVKKGVLDPY